MDVSGWIRRHNDHFLLKRNEPRFYENFHQTNISGIKIQNYFKSKLGYSYIGLESRNENILSNILGEDMNDSIRVNGTTDAYYYKQFRRNYTGIFIEQKINLNNFYISGGFLINYNREYDRNWNIFPGLDLSYQFPELNLKIFASAGRSLRLPTFTDMFYSDPVNQGNPSLQPEELLSFESGLEYRNGNFSTGLSIFSDYGKNVIDWVIFQGNSVYEAQNISNVNSRGVETNIQFLNEDPVGKLAISNTSLSYAFTGQELSNGDWESKYAGDFLKSKFTSQIQFVLFHHFYLKYNLVFQSRNGSFIDVDDNSGARFSVAFKPYWISDIKFSFKQRNYSLFIKASNLFNTEYNDVGNLIQPGRWISGGMELSF